MIYLYWALGYLGIGLLASIILIASALLSYPMVPVNGSVFHRYGVVLRRIPNMGLNIATVTLCWPVIILGFINRTIRLIFN